MARRTPGLTVALCLAHAALHHGSAQAVWTVAPRYHTVGQAALFAARVGPRWLIAEEFTYDVHSGEAALAVATRARAAPGLHLVVDGAIGLAPTPGEVVFTVQWER